jgi:hypothetical protein
VLASCCGQQGWWALHAVATASQCTNCHHHYSAAAGFNTACPTAQYHDVHCIWFPGAAVCACSTGNTFYFGANLISAKTTDGGKTFTIISKWLDNLGGFDKTLIKAWATILYPVY